MMDSPMGDLRTDQSLGSGTKPSASIALLGAKFFIKFDHVTRAKLVSRCI